MSQSDSERCRQLSLARPGRCTNAVDWELAQDRALDEMTDDQLAYLDRGIAITFDERGWVRDGDNWRLDV